jgi:hypothetical protein
LPFCQVILSFSGAEEYLDLADELNPRRSRYEPKILVLVCAHSSVPSSTVFERFRTLERIPQRFPHAA